MEKARIVDPTLIVPKDNNAPMLLLEYLAENNDVLPVTKILNNIEDAVFEVKMPIDSMNKACCYINENL